MLHVSLDIDYQISGQVAPAQCLRVGALSERHGSRPPGAQGTRHLIPSCLSVIMGVTLPLQWAQRVKHGTKGDYS